MEIYDDDSGAIASETFQTFLERTLEKKSPSFPCLRPVSTVYLYHVKESRKRPLPVVPNESISPFLSKDISDSSLKRVWMNEHLSMVKIQYFSFKSLILSALLTVNALLQLRYFNTMTDILLYNLIKVNNPYWKRKYRKFLLCIILYAFHIIIFWHARHLMIRSIYGSATRFNCNN